MKVEFVALGLAIAAAGYTLIVSLPPPWWLKMPSALVFGGIFVGLLLVIFGICVLVYGVRPTLPQSAFNWISLICFCLVFGAFGTWKLVRLWRSSPVLERSDTVTTPNITLSTRGPSNISRHPDQPEAKIVDSRPTQTPGAKIQGLRDRIEALNDAQKRFEGFIPGAVEKLDMIISAECQPLRTARAFSKMGFLFEATRNLKQVLDQVFPNNDFKFDGNDRFGANPYAQVPPEVEAGITQIREIDRCRRAYYDSEQIKATIEEARGRFKNEIDEAQNSIRAIALKEIPSKVLP